MEGEEHEVEYDYEEEYEPISRRFSRADIFVVGFGLLTGISGAFRDSFAQSQQLAAAHANWVVDQRYFHEQAALDIETITSGENDG